MSTTPQIFSSLSAETITESLRRSARIRMEMVAGPLPDPGRRCALAVEEVETFVRERIRYRKLRFTPESGDHCTGWLLEGPSAAGAVRPALLCCHQTTTIGKDEPAGLGGQANLHYALELARRGYVTFAPDYPGFGESHTDPYALGYASATMKGIWNHIRSVDLLVALPGVDAERIGVIGHSLGGHNALFLAAFDLRIRLVVSSCGFTRFTRNNNDDKRGDLTDWSHRGYMPRIASEFGCHADNMPFDFPDILLAILPRPVLINAPLLDAFAVDGVRECLRVVEPFYAMFQASGRLRAFHPDCGHDFPPKIRAAAYDAIGSLL